MASYTSVIVCCSLKGAKRATPMSLQHFHEPLSISQRS